MQSFRDSRHLFSLGLALFWGLAGNASAADLSDSIQRLQQVGPKGKGHQQAVEAAALLSREAGSEDLVTILAGMDEVGPIAENWFRGVVEAVAQRALEQQGALPQKQLEAFLADTDNPPRARRLAYELILRVDQTADDRLMPGMLDDPSLELRREAVQRVIDEASGKQGEAAEKIYKKALYHARDLDQVKLCVEELEKLEHPIDTAAHLGFLTRWKLIGPFDNKDKQGYDVAYPPEKELDFGAEYEGQKGKVRWKEHTTEDPYGIVDLNEVMGKHKGAIIYAAAEFVSEDARAVELRLGCINANKVWLNGKLLGGYEVYHAGMNVDQYHFDAKLRKGKNTILLKICQNEQTESWAQRWQFQLRVTDQLGGAVLSLGRQPALKAAGLETKLR